MPKRSAEEKIEYYKRKISKIKTKVNKSSDERNQDIICEDPEDSVETVESISNGVSSNEEPPVQEPFSLSQEPDENYPDIALQETVHITEDVLDPDILEALGASTPDAPDFGDPIHQNLATLWLPILKKGLNKDDKTKFTKEYLPPENCKLIRAPKLNEEIFSAASESTRFRDKKIHDFQQQLGAGITAINKGMGVLMTGESKVQALKYASDGCRILTDLHYLLTKDRTKLILPSLDKKFMQVIKDVDRDEMLFGSSLSDKIRASKAIERQGQQIKNNTPRVLAGTSHSNRSNIQGNWMGPPRYTSNRGQRGGLRKPVAAGAVPRRQYYPQNPPKNTQAKPRATTRK